MGIPSITAKTVWRLGTSFTPLLAAILADQHHGEVGVTDAVSARQLLRLFAVDDLTIERAGALADHDADHHVAIQHVTATCVDSAQRFHQAWIAVRRREQQERTTFPAIVAEFGGDSRA